MIYCPIHKIKENSSLDLTVIFKNFGKVRACECHKCRRTYIDVCGLKTGSLGRTAKGFEVINLHKYYLFPKVFHVLDESQLNMLSKNKTLININEFIHNKKIFNLRSNLDPTCKEYYITKTTYNLERRLFSKFNIDIIDERKNDRFPYEPIYVKFPKKVFVLNENDLADLSNRRNFMNVSGFLSKKKTTTYKIPSKYDIQVDRYYISEAIYKKNEGFLKNKITTVFRDLDIRCSNEENPYNIPDYLYLLPDLELNKLDNSVDLSNVHHFMDGEGIFYRVQAKYDSRIDRFYISHSSYNQQKDTLQNFGVQVIDYLHYGESNIIDKLNLPSKIYLVNKNVLNKIETDNKLVDISNFKDTSYTYFTIPLKYDENHDVYFMIKELFNDYLDIINSLGITISSNKNMKKMVMDIYKIENEKLPLKVSVIKDRLCPICHNSLPKKSLSNVYNLETVYIKVFYCKNCNQYYISKNDYDKNTELYLNNIKEIHDLDHLNVKNIYDLNEYIYQPVHNFTYGIGKIAKIEGSAVYVEFKGNVKMYHFPDCFKTGLLSFENKSYQSAIMEMIDNISKKYEKRVYEIPLKNKTITVQRTSYTDVRRIPGLVYKIQLIGSSNNHATRIHPVEDVVVKVAYKNPKSKTFDIVSIPMHYCSRCDKYFDMKQSFLQTLQKYNLDINYFVASFESETGHPIVFKQMDLREFSKLKLFGYSVGANGLSTGARHELLDFILKNHLMTASEIKSQLQFNIRFIGKKAHMYDAVGDWEKDIDYVNNYISSGKIHWRY